MAKPAHAMKKNLLILFSLCSLFATAQNNPASNHGNKFEQLGGALPTPNSYRTASGAPGPSYWQQRCDYDIKASLDEKNLKITGTETVTYWNNSPDALQFLWLQLDENEHSSVNNANYQTSSRMPQAASSQQLLSDTVDGDNGYGHIISRLTDATGKALKYTINKTMMRVELPQPLKPGQKFIFNCSWSYKIHDIRIPGAGRGGFEYFPEDKNYIFNITQWYPRLCVYSDFQGWQNHQFTGRGEFALTFGNFKVQMTVPADHIVAATGACQNYAQVLNATQLSRWQKAQTATEPVEIVTLAEAQGAESRIATGTKTWIFKADNVRDFAWTSSRKHVWDAMPINIEGKKVMCMSFYPKEAYALWRKYSTKSVAHAIRTYSKFSIAYPYPVAQSISWASAVGSMEYPMICYNNGRPQKDGTYSEQVKNGVIGVIIHEVGHNFFPMIVNSDERQWSWMDEGLNTFVQYLAEELWDNKFPSRRGPAWTITDYMKLPKDQLEPIMTNSENIVGFSPNAYSKPATGLNILRETILGRELFDYAFKEYSRRWAFKHPEPADFFRTMEDASAEDLDWFWRGWFFGTDACDISLDSVKYAKPSFASNAQPQRQRQATIDPPAVPAFDDISKVRNREDNRIVFETDRDTSLRDFYWRYDRGLEPYDSSSYAIVVPAGNDSLSEEEKARLSSKHFYELSFSNKGGLVMPLIIEWTYKDGTKEVERIPAQVWRLNENRVTKFYMKDKEVASIKLDPMRETADINESNNSWGGTTATASRFSVFKQRQAGPRGAGSGGTNPMQKAAEKKGF